MSYLTRAIGAAQLLVKANAPTIMVSTGIASMGAAAIIGAKKTLNVEEAITPHVEMLDRIENALAQEVEGYTNQKALEDRIRVYARISLDMSKLYFIPGTLFIGGAALVFGGHRIMLKRNATLAIAFTTVSKAFEAYRGRVVEAHGHDADQYLMSGSFVTHAVDPETGEKVTGRDWSATEMDPYNRIFEQGATSAWRPDLGVNRMFISQQQRYAQDRLNLQGHLYLSDVYEALGFPESDVSRVVGWKVKRNPDGSKDFPFVDFGLDKPLPDDWKFNKENAIYLDFNCQGLIVGGKLQRILEKA